MTKTILKELKGPKDVASLVRRWHILKSERAAQIAPLRIALERHRVEHMLIEKLGKVI